MSFLALSTASLMVAGLVLLCSLFFLIEGHHDAYTTYPSAFWCWVRFRKFGAVFHQMVNHMPAAAERMSIHRSLSQKGGWSISVTPKPGVSSHACLNVLQHAPNQAWAQALFDQMPNPALGWRITGIALQRTIFDQHYAFSVHLTKTAVLSTFKPRCIARLAQWIVAAANVGRAQTRCVVLDDSCF